MFAGRDGLFSARMRAEGAEQRALKSKILAHIRTNPNTDAQETLFGSYIDIAQIGRASTEVKILRSMQEAAKVADAAAAGDLPSLRW